VKDSNSTAKKDSPEPEHITRILVVVNELKNIEGAVNYLESKNYEVVFVPTVSHMAHEIVNFKPHAVLLSWNTKNTSVDKIYRLLTTKFNVPCLVFAEESTSQTLGKMSRSGIPDILTPPVMGPNLMMRLRSLILKKHKTKKKVSQKELTSDLNWEHIQDPENPKEKIWKATNPNAPDKNQIYFFKGPGRPQYNSMKQEWDFKGSNELYIQERAPADDSKFLDTGLAMSLELEIEAIKSGGDGNEYEIEKKAPVQALDKKIEIQPTAKKPDDEAPLLKLEKEEKKKKKVGLDSILAQSLKAVLTKTKSEKNPNFSKSISVTKMTISTLSSPRFMGYIVCANTSDTFVPEWMKSAMILLGKEMKSHGEVIKESPVITEVEFKNREFLSWGHTAGDFVISINESDLAFAFFSTSSLPQVIEADDQTMLGISLKKDLIPNVKIGFDIYLQLAENRKFLHYLSSGQVFTREMYDKFKKFQVLLMFIRKSDKEAFFAYCAKNAVDI
jgi:CheY-like chemotaxis protein